VDLPPNTGSQTLSIDSVSVQLQILEVAVDARDGIVVDIDLEDIEITWWVVLKVWLSERWKAFKNVFTNADK
jgi:hypothetical protein